MKTDFKISFIFIIFFTVPSLVAREDEAATIIDSRHILSTSTIKTESEIIYQFYLSGTETRWAKTITKQWFPFVVPFRLVLTDKLEHDNAAVLCYTAGVAVHLTIVDLTTSEEISVDICQLDRNGGGYIDDVIGALVTGYDPETRQSEITIQLRDRGGDKISARVLVRRQEKAWKGWMIKIIPFLPEPLLKPDNPIDWSKTQWNEKPPINASKQPDNVVPTTLPSPP